MHRFPFNTGTQLFPKRLISYQVNITAQQILDVELNPEILPRGGWPIKASKNIHIAPFRRMATRKRPEYCEGGDAKPRHDLGLVRPEHPQNVIARHDSDSPQLAI